MPLHPAIVHLPLGLALALGAVLSTVAWFSRRDASPSALWWLGVALAAIVAGSALLASSAGEDEAHRLQEAASPALRAAIEAHADAAGAFTWTAVLVTLLALVAGVAAKRRVRRALQLAAALLAFALIPLALRAGQAGAELVWRHDVPRVRAAAGER